MTKVNLLGERKATLVMWTRPVTNRLKNTGVFKQPQSQYGHRHKIVTLPIAEFINFRTGFNCKPSRTIKDAIYSKATFTRPWERRVKYFPHRHTSYRNIPDAISFNILHYSRKGDLGSISSYGVV